MSEGNWASVIGDPRFIPAVLAADGCAPAAFAQTLNASDDAWIVVGPPDLALNPAFAELVIAASQQQPQVDIFYGDEALIGSPHDDDEIILKPATDAVLLIADAYMGWPLVVRSGAWRELGGLRPETRTAAAYDLVLRALTAGRGVDRIPQVLAVHPHPRLQPQLQDREDVLRRWLSLSGEAFDVTPGSVPETLRLQRRLTEFPAVSLVVSTKQAVGRGGDTGKPPQPLILDLLESIANTDWPMEKLTVVLTDALADDLIYRDRDWPFRLRRLVAHDGATRNDLWRAADTEHLVLMSDDVVVKDGGWLQALLTFTTQDDFGAAGVTPSSDPRGTASRAAIDVMQPGRNMFAWLGGGPPLPTNPRWAATHHQCAAMAGAVLATKRTILEELSGFDERFRADFADADLCLRMRMVGYRVVYTPFAKIARNPAVSQQPIAPRGSEIARFMTRWGEFFEQDPTSHPQLAKGASTDALLQEVRRWWQQTRLRDGPIISLIVPTYNVAARYLERCIESVRVQTYPNWELCLSDDGSTNPETLEALQRYQGTDPRIQIRYLAENQGIAAASNRAVDLSTGSYLAMLDNDDELSPDALLEIASAISADPMIDCLYTDEDKLDPEGAHCEDYCKPDWSPEHLESVMYVLHLLVVRKSLFLAIGGFRGEYNGAQDYDLMLRISRATDRIHHVPKIAYHWRMVPGSAAAQVDAKPTALDAASRALADHIAIKYNGAASVEAGLLPGHFRVRHRIAGEPPVTLLIPTHNSRTSLPGRGEFVMVDHLIASIRQKTSYKNYRILVVDDANSSPEQLASRREAGVETITYPGPFRPFNFAHKSNFCMRQVTTEQVVIMNDDMEIIDDGWLDALLEFSQLPEIGIVGAKLFHADGTIQHCGMVIGMNGSTAHLYHSYDGDSVGYYGFTHIIRNYSAVTAACMATRKSVWERAGGLDEKFATDFNDTDFCLRVLELGYRIVYTPYAQLYHFENKSFVRTTQNRQEAALFHQRWQKYIDNDPYYNPNLIREGVEPILRDVTAERDNSSAIKLSA